MLTAFGGGVVMLWGGIILTGKMSSLDAERYRDEILKQLAFPYLHSQVANSILRDHRETASTSGFVEDGLPAVLTPTPLNTCEINLFFMLKSKLISQPHWLTCNKCNLKNGI